jgi:exopolysaccharide biosynthesis polyprenyl glycosylphosphotransferase
MYYLESIYTARSLCAAALDASCLALAFAVTWVIQTPEISGLTYSGIALGMIGASFAVLFFNDAYRPDTLGDGAQTTTAILSTMGVGLAGAVVLYFLIPVPKDVVPTLATVAGIFFPLLVGGRIVLRLLLTLKPLTSNVLVIGATDLGHQIADALHERHDSGIHMVGFLSDDPGLREQGARFRGFPVIGQVHQLEKILAERRVDQIVVASKDRSEHFPKDALMNAKIVQGIRVESGVKFLERLSGRIFMRDLRASYLIFNEGFENRRIHRIAQRTLDIVGASILLTLSFPVLTLAAIAIKIDSPGPVLFRQTRLGRHNKTFLMNKLRSMRDNAEAESGAVFTADKDDRITRVGHFIRRTRLDELPQFWNVLMGDMSLVGPRAERPEFAETLADYYPYYNTRTSVRPGITGWAQTRFGYVNNVEDYEEKLALDLYYLKYRGLLLDLAILAQTVKTVLHFRGL